MFEDQWKSEPAMRLTSLLEFGSCMRLSGFPRFIWLTAQILALVLMIALSAFLGVAAGAFL